MLLRLLLGFLLLSIAWPCHALEVTFERNVEVEGVTISLGDIAHFSDTSELSSALSSQIVARSPAPGQVLSLDSRQLISDILRDHGPLDTVFWKGSSGVSVTRKAVTIQSTKVIDVINEYIADNKARLPKAEISFKPESLPLPFLLPTGNLSWDVIPSSPGIIGSSRFTILFKVDGRVRKNLSVRGHTQALASVVVANKRLRYGDIISRDAITTSIRDIAKIQNYITDPSQVVGSAVKRALNNGTAVDTDAIEQPPLIRRGEFVKIVITHNGLMLTATGIAKTNGKKDEIIKVKNVSSNKLVFCRVHAPGLVEVKI